MSSSVTKVKRVSFARERLRVDLADGRSIEAPLAWYPTLFHASITERKAWKPCGAGRGIYWPKIDYHLSVDGLLRGAREARGVRRPLARAT